MKKNRFSGKNWPFTTTSGQIILFLFKSDHFRTYFLYMTRYISRPVHDPHAIPPHPPCPKSGGRDPQTSGLTSLLPSTSRCPSNPHILFTMQSIILSSSSAPGSWLPSNHVHCRLY